ncbi:MAG: type II toxin-antitoxin system HicB family antitoxin [Thermoplasmatota archaeon]
MALRQVLVYRGEDDMWIAEVPSLPGCVTQGSTREEAITNAREAIDAFVEALANDGLRVPEETFDAVLVAV